MPGSAAPLTELGYQASGQTYWQHLEDETTPELIWPLSVWVYDRMRRQDSQVASVLRAVSYPVRRTRWWIEPNGARPEVVQLVSEDLGLPVKGEPPKRAVRTRDRFSWSEHMRLALLMLPHGHSYFEQVYRIDERAFARLRKLAWRPPRSISDFKVADDGGLEGIEQIGKNGKAITIPVDRLVAYVLDREGGNWTGSSLLRPAYKHWLLKDRLLRVQTQTVERNGMGVPRYTGAPNEDNLTKGLAIAASWRSGEAAGAAIPHESKLDLVGVTGDLPDADKPIRYHDEQIARAVLAHFLNLGTQTGSWALGTTFADFFTLSLQTLAQQLADVASQHIVEDLVDLNWGEDEPAPLVGFEEIGSRQVVTAQAIKMLIESGAVFADRELEEALRQQFNLPPKQPLPPGTTPIPGQDMTRPETIPEEEADA